MLTGISITNLSTTAETNTSFRSRISTFLVIIGCLCTCANVPISLVLMHVGFAMMAAGVVIGARPVHRLPGFTWGCLFAAWQISGMLFRPEQDPRPFFRQGHGTTFIWFALFSAIIVLAEPRWRRWAIRLMVLAVLASFILALLQFFIGHGGKRPFRINESGIRHVMSTGFAPLHLTQGFIMTIMALILCSQQSSSRASALMLWSGRLMAIMAVLFANSRSGLTALLGGFSAWFAAAQGRIKWCSLIVVAVGGPLMAMWLWIVNAGALHALVNLQDGRLTIWQVAAHVVVEHPWFGVGEGRYAAASDLMIPKLYPDHSQDVWLDSPDAHNSILGLSSEHGIPAFLLFVIFIGSILRHLHRRRMDNPHGWRLGCGAAAALAFGSQFEHYAGHSTPSYAFFIALAFAVAMDRKWLESVGLVEPEKLVEEPQVK